MSAIYEPHELAHPVGSRVQHPNAPKLRGTVLAVTQVLVVWDETDVMRANRVALADPRTSSYPPDVLIPAVECDHRFEPVVGEDFDVCPECSAVRDLPAQEEVRGS